MEKIKLGLIINPIAGLGGSVGLKGTDGKADEAVRLGAVPKANQRAEEALAELLPLKEKLAVFTGKGSMGEFASLKYGFKTCVLIENSSDPDAADTIRLAGELVREKVKLILFAGGDGTAADIYKGAGDLYPSLGIPAGVKIHSPVYAKSPEAAGKLALLFLEGRTAELREEEVLDTDEGLYRKGVIATSLLGYLTVPYKRIYCQGKKAPTPPSEKSAIRSIALRVTAEMEKDVYYIIGAGTTTRGIMEELGLPCTLIGVDIVRNRRLEAKDTYGEKIVRMIRGKKAKLILTVTGGQGFLFGRGNQQITPEVIRETGKDNIIVIATAEKLYALKGEPLWTDSSDKALDKELEGYIRVITGYHESVVTKIKAPG